MHSRERSLRNHFAGLTLDRRDEWRLDLERLRAAWSEARLVLVDFEGRVLSRQGRLFAPSACELDPQLFPQASFLGVQDSQCWFALPAAAWPNAAVTSELSWLGLREAAVQWPSFDSGLFAYAKALLLWQSRARYCGACGTPAALTRAGHCAQCPNPRCGLAHFPRTDAAVIVIVIDHGRALLGRQPGWPPGRYSTLAGFVEPGESLEDAVRREVREEAGVRVGFSHYQSSQPWPFPGALMVGFRAQAIDTAIHLGDELEDARWLEASELIDSMRRGDIQLPPRISVSRRLIEDWLEDTLGPAALDGLHEI